MRSNSMSSARAFLVRKYGESFGQTMFANMLQMFWLGPEDEVNEAMRRAVYGA